MRNKIVEYAPAVVVLLYIAYRQQRQIERLIGDLEDCYEAERKARLAALQRLESITAHD